MLPARVADYSPALLDELTLAGEVVWAGAGSLPGNDGWSPSPRPTSPRWCCPPADAGSTDRCAEMLRAALDAGSAMFFRALADRAPASADRRRRRRRPSGIWSGPGC